MRLAVLLLFFPLVCVTFVEGTRSPKTNLVADKKLGQEIFRPDDGEKSALAVGQSASPLPLPPVAGRDGALKRDSKDILQQPRQGLVRSTYGLRSIQLWVDAHNQERGQALPAQPLEWDRKIARFAQRHADSISHQTNCTPDFNEDNGDYGENLFWGIYEYGLRKWTITEAVAQWVKQKRFYDYATNTCEAGQNCAAYLQVVWNETKKIGCAEVFCPFKAEFNGVAQFFVCNYFPAASIGPGHRHPY
eukprot:TRINITY_DN1124_c0_g2_i2.p1 TRINITY_DN1124_c0_g2~~TRINITY_DN1124_c0_g2_i2.p1  ORF type:complete len:247 (+),score=32.97 TRINITY_DN1124_c0_g2_i2:289-1029(+)